MRSRHFAVRRASTSILASVPLASVSAGLPVVNSPHQVAFRLQSSSSGGGGGEWSGTSTGENWENTPSTTTDASAWGGQDEGVALEEGTANQEWGADGSQSTTTQQGDATQAWGGDQEGTVQEGNQEWGGAQEGTTQEWGSDNSAAAQEGGGADQADGDVNSGWGGGKTAEDVAVVGEAASQEEGGEGGITENSETSFSAVPDLDLSSLPAAPMPIVEMTSDEKKEKSIKEIYQPEGMTNEQILALNTIGLSRRSSPSSLNLVRNRFYNALGIDTLVPLQEAVSIILCLGDINKMYNEPSKIIAKSRIEQAFKAHPDIWTVAGDYVMMHPSHTLAKSAFRVTRANAAGGVGRTEAIDSITKFSSFDIAKNLSMVPDRGGKLTDHPYFNERKYNFDFHSECVDLFFYDLHRQLIVPRDRYKKNIVIKAMERAIYKAGVPVMRKNGNQAPGRGIGARNIKLVVYRHLKAIEKENAWNKSSTESSWEDDEDDSAAKSTSGDEPSDEAKRVSRLEEAGKLDAYLEQFGYKDLDDALKSVHHLHFMFRGDLIKMDWQQQVLWACSFIPPHGCSESHFRKLLMTSHALPNHSRFEERLPGTTLKEWLETYWTRYFEIEETGPNAGKPGMNAPLWVKSKLHVGAYPIPASIEEPMTGYGGFEEDCRLTCMGLDVDEGRVFPDGVDMATQEGGTSLRVGEGYGLEDIITLLPRATALEYHATSWYQLVKKTPTLSERVRLSDTAPNTRASVFVDASEGFNQEMFQEACESNNVTALLANKPTAKYSPLYVIRTEEDAAFSASDEVCEDPLINPTELIPTKITSMLQGSKFHANVDHEIIYIFCRVAHVDKYMAALKEAVPKVLGDNHTAGGRVVEINIVSARDKETVPVGKHHPLPPKGTIKGKKPEDGEEGVSAVSEEEEKGESPGVEGEKAVVN